MSSYPGASAWRTACTTVVLAALATFAGCGWPGSQSGTVTEGTIYSVEYEDSGGRTTGFTRLNDSRAVPGGSGSWNVDARGRLDRDFLVITRPQRRDLGPLVVPVRRLIIVQFGDGGIRDVDENHPAAGH